MKLKTKEIQNRHQSLRDPVTASMINYQHTEKAYFSTRITMTIDPYLSKNLNGDINTQTAEFGPSENLLLTV